MILRLLKSREGILLAALLALLVLVESRFSGFAAPGNLAAVFNDTSILIILALGQTLVILTRCIDLSVASNLALTGMVTAMLNAAFPGIPVVRADRHSGRTRHPARCVQRHSGLEARDPAHRGHAGHADHLSRHGLPALERGVGEQPRDERGLQGLSTRGLPRSAGAVLDCVDRDRGLCHRRHPHASGPGLLCRGRQSTCGGLYRHRCRPHALLPPSPSRARWPGFAAISGCRAMRWPMSTWRAGSSSTSSPPA